MITTHYSYFFFNDTATTEIYTLSLHDALPISCTASEPKLVSRQTIWRLREGPGPHSWCISLRCLFACRGIVRWPDAIDRKSTRLNSSHQIISYAVFCLKKKKYARLIFSH